MQFARPRKKAYMLYLDEEKQAAYDLERYGHRPRASSVFGNDQRCTYCGSPPGKQCQKEDGSYRDYPHQARRYAAFTEQQLKAGACQ